MNKSELVKAVSEKTEATKKRYRSIFKCFYRNSY